MTALYERFMLMQIKKVGDYCAPIEGAADVLALLHGSRVKVEARPKRACHCALICGWASN